MNKTAVFGRKHFSGELEKLKTRVIYMSRLATTAVERAVESLLKQNIKIANKVIEDDDKIDALELKIENKCMRLLALQQPMAEDLRTIGACFKIITDLERIGDRAEDIAELSRELAGRPHVKPLVDIPRMSKLAIGMINDSMKAFKKRDSYLAWGLGERDDEVDNLMQQVTRELFSYAIEDPKKTTDAFRLMFIASFLERVADHATNIGERVIYMVKGERVKIN